MMIKLEGKKIFVHLCKIDLRCNIDIYIWAAVPMIKDYKGKQISQQLHILKIINWT